jgi:leader peptidase (prepilin peptidase)/N-methyltransferase
VLTRDAPVFLVLAALLGLAVGSFLNVLAWRLPRGLSLLGPGSFCPSCERRLSWWELVPVLSYLALRGRCRTCRARISPVYPAVEAGTAVLFAGAWARWGPGPQALGAAVLGSLLVAAAVVDARHRIIPDAVTLPGLGLGLLVSALNPEVGLLRALAGVLVGGGLLLGLAVLTNGGMGGGDIKLAAMMGAFLGWSGVGVALLVGFMSGALVGGVMMLAGRKDRRDLMAFGPFLAAGGIAAAFWGQELVGWYLRVFFG